MRGVLATQRDLTIEAVQLSQQDRGLELRHTEIPAKPVVLVPLAAWNAADVLQRPHRLCAPLAVGQDGTALACRQCFRGLKAESPEVSNGTDAAAAPLRTMSLSRIFNHGQTMTGSQGSQGVHLGRAARQVDRDDGACSWREDGGGRLGVQRVRVRVEGRE